MAEIIPTAVGPGRVFKWEGVTLADTCKPVGLPGYGDKSVEMHITSGAVTDARVLGSLFFETFADLKALRGFDGEVITMGQSDVYGIAPNVIYVAPDIVTGAGTADFYVGGGE